MNFLDQIAKMDKKSEEFFDLYCAVNEKYWTIDEPDDFQKACMFLNQLINRGEDFASEVVLTTRVATELMQMNIKKLPAIHGAFQMKNGQQINFDFYINKTALTNLEKMLRQTIIVKTAAEGGAE